MTIFIKLVNPRLLNPGLNPHFFNPVGLFNLPEVSAKFLWFFLQILYLKYAGFVSGTLSSRKAMTGRRS
jgi:hypothetical protein